MEQNDCILVTGGTAQRRRQINHYDHPAPIWPAISLITALWSPESRLSFCKACAALHYSWGLYLALHYLYSWGHIYTDGWAVGMIVFPSIHCLKWL